MNVSKIKTYLLAATAVGLAASLMIFPKESFEASLRGLHMWWEVVFPSLLPFFIVSELLIGFGVVTFLGVLLEPLMRPLFRVPGVGGFVWAMGLASGYPAGAKLTARLRQEKKLTRIEAERLVSFTNSSNPLFIFGAISVGFFHNPSLGIIFALSHYLGNTCVGILMRFHGFRAEKTSSKKKKEKGLLKNAFAAIHEERLKDKRPIGKLLGDAIQSSVQTLLMIGGFIILFSVLNKILYLVNISVIAANVLSIILTFFGISTELSLPLVAGMFEITSGSQMASTINTELLHKVIITSFILAFNGFSVQAQVASILAETDIRFKPYFFARILHGIFAALFVFLLWDPLYENHSRSIPAFIQTESQAYFLSGWELILNIGPSITLFSLLLYILISLKRSM